MYESPAAYQHLSGEECSLLLRFPLRMMSIGLRSVFYCDPIPPPPPSARAVDKCLVSCGGGRHGEEVADASCRTERSTSGSVSAVLICHKCPPFPMAKDKGQRTYEEHAFLMWHSHQIHHSGLSRMPMTLYSSSNYSEATRQYECKPWRAHLPLTCRRPKQFSTSSPFEAWTCEPCVDSGVVFDWE